MVYDKVLTVFKNKEGLKDYYDGYEESNNYITILMSDDEYRENESKHIFDAINERCNLLIDNCESEVISAENVGVCLRLCKTLAIQEDTAFFRALKEAEGKGFGIAIDF